jgi:hypothetical protein
MQRRAAGELVLKGEPVFIGAALSDGEVAFDDVRVIKKAAGVCQLEFREEKLDLAGDELARAGASLLPTADERRRRESSGEKTTVSVTAVVLERDQAGARHARVRREEDERKAAAAAHVARQKEEQHFVKRVFEIIEAVTGTAGHGFLTAGWLRSRCPDVELSRFLKYTARNKTVIGVELWLLEAHDPYGGTPSRNAPGGVYLLVKL